MADDLDEEARTEAPSERRLAQAFEQGDVPLSHDLVGAAALLAAGVALVQLAPRSGQALVALVAESLQLSAQTPFSTYVARIPSVAWPVAAGVAVAAFVATAATFGQTQGHVWSDRAAPDLSRVFTTERLTHFVSKTFVAELFIALVKAAAVAWVCWTSVRADFLTLPRLFDAQPAEQLAGLFRPLGVLTTRVALTLAFFAGVDLALVRWKHRKKHMMTRDELKREMKEDEGDPLIRGARKRKHRELVKRNAVRDTRKADALIVNPTHIAIAVRYRKEEGAAPRVLAKGKGVLAEAMREEARKSAIPIVQDVPLARLLYKKVKVGGPVPAETYKAVAAVLAFVYRITGRTSGVAASSSGTEARS